MFTVLSESLTGNIGDDWKYSLEVQVYGSGAGSHAMISEGTLEVPEHPLAAGATQAPPGPPAPLVLAAGEAGGEIRVELRLKAVEVDVMMNDTGEKTASFKATCPQAGAAAVTQEREISVGVEEEPTGIGTAVLTLRYQYELQSDG
jgi:hypothetical protein